jgi:hypothetical protein
MTKEKEKEFVDKVVKETYKKYPKLSKALAEL